MKCPKCDFENPESQRFCGDCGAMLQSSEDAPTPYEETLQAPKQELTTGSTFAGRYSIIEELGKGGMGKVYKVLDKELGEKIALKLLKPEITADEKTIKRFRNELKTARQISHKNVCRMYHLSKEEATHYITMEYVRGEDLKSMIRMMGQLSEGQAIFIAKQICEGLMEAHKLGIVHRDLKPQNIMIDKAGNTKIMDFGIARSVKGKGITDAGMIIGTPEYMSPEQVESKGVDQRSDIYSLGIILYEMVTGRVPFEGDTPFSVAFKHKTETPDDPRKINAQISEDLSLVILKCLEKDKEKRFQSARELLAELDQIEKGIPTTERVIPKTKPTTSEELTVTFKKRWLGYAALAAIVIIAGITLIYFLNRGSAPPDEVEKEKKMLVVLPFENLGPPEDEYFADGITEEIMSRLSSVKDLGVIGRTSAMHYKNTEKPIHQIGEELGVDYILEGTVRWQRAAEGESRVRVTPQLIRVTDSTQLWSEPQDAVLADIFRVQSDIAQKVVKSLDVTLGAFEQRALDAKPTENMEAYDYYMRGQDYYDRSLGQDKGYQLALEMYEKAIELDPYFALAYTKIAVVHGYTYWRYLDRTKERLDKMKKAAEKAMELDPELSESHFALGLYHYFGKLDYDKALEQFAAAQKLQPSNIGVLSWIAAVQRRQGKFEQAVENIKKASELDPTGNYEAQLANTYYTMRRYEEAEHLYNKSIEKQLDNPWYYGWLSILYLRWQGDTVKAREVLDTASKRVASFDYTYLIQASFLVEMIDKNYQKAFEQLSLTSKEAIEEQFFFIPKDLLYAQVYGCLNDRQSERKHYELALQLLQEKVKENPEDSRLHSALGIAYAGLDRKEEAIKAGKKGVELLPVSKEAWAGSYRVMDLAQIYAMVGEPDTAINQIKYLLTIPGELTISLLRIDPKWDPLRDHPRFQKLIERNP